MILRVTLALLTTLIMSRPGSAQVTDTSRNFRDSVVVRFAEADLRSVIQTLGRYLDRPLLTGTVPQVRITFESPVPLPRAAIPQLLRGLVEAHGLTLIADSAFYRVDQRPPAPAAAPPAAQELRGPNQLFVLRLRHARANEVTGTVAALFGITASYGGRGLSNGALSDELRRNVVAAPGTAGAGQSAAAPAGGSLAGPVTIVPDELTNSLLIRSSQLDYDVIRAAVEQLDLRPLQVIIQVLIVEARKNRLFAVGVDATIEHVDVGNTASLAAGLAGGGLGTLVVEIMKLGSPEFDAILRAAVSRGDARIVSRPVLLASNNREARILVGSQRPFVQVSRSLPTDSPTRDQVVQYKDVGTKLTVIPTINSDGYVSLLIRQEVNNATSETQFDAPVISTREAETQVLVRDQQTIVLGGMRERQTDVVKTGIPILSSLPIVGGLFGSQERRTTETELYLFITPIILRDDHAVDSTAQSLLDRADRVAPVKRDH